MLVAKRISSSMRPEVGGISRPRQEAAAKAMGRRARLMMKPTTTTTTRTTTTTTTTTLIVSTFRPRLPRLSRLSRPLLPPAAATPPDGERSKEDIERILRSLEPPSSSNSSPSTSKQQQQRSSNSSSPLASSPLSPSNNDGNNNNFFLGPPQGRGTFLLVLLNVAVFALATLASSKLSGPFFAGRLSRLVSSLALSHSNPRWWQLFTCSFLHLDLQHLAGNLFSLLVFGRDIELSEGAGSVWLYYLITAFFASLASLLFGPKGAISLGASGAVFGLFAVAVAGKIAPNLRSLVESSVLASFVVPQVLSEVKSQALGGTVTASGSTVGHVAHLGGAAAGVLVVLLLSRLPPAGAAGGGGAE